MPSVIAGTGHRLGEKLGGYDDRIFKRLVGIAWDYLFTEQPDAVISGMALGWDQALATGAIDLGIPVTAYIPFIGQADAWPQRSIEKYWHLLEQCAAKKTVSLGGYSAEKMQIRNQAMVHDCTKIVALWDGSDGGTANCVRYAKKAGRPVTNLWEAWSCVSPR